MKISAEQLAQSLFRASPESIADRKRILTSAKEQGKIDLIRRYLRAGKTQEFILQTVFGLESDIKDKPLSFFQSPDGVRPSPHAVWEAKKQSALRFIHEVANGLVEEKE